MASSTEPAIQAKPTKVSATRTPRPKSTFMLHDPTDMTAKGKFTAPGYREAALKAASRGHEKILLRKCGTSEIREFEGSIVTLDNPKPVVRGTQSVTYTKKSKVKFVGKHAFNGKIDDSETTENAPEGTTPATA